MFDHILYIVSPVSGQVGGALPTRLELKVDVVLDLSVAVLRPSRPRDAHRLTLVVIPLSRDNVSDQLAVLVVSFLVGVGCWLMLLLLEINVSIIVVTTGLVIIVYVLLWSRCFEIGGFGGWVARCIISRRLLMIYGAILLGDVLEEVCLFSQDLLADCVSATWHSRSNLRDSHQPIYLSLQY